MYTFESTVDYATRQPTFRLVDGESPVIWRHFVGKTTKLCRKCGQRVDDGILNPHHYPGFDSRSQRARVSEDDDEELDKNALGPLWPRAAAARIQRGFRCLKSRRIARIYRAVHLREARLRSALVLASAWRCHTARAAYFSRRAMRVYLAFVRSRCARLQSVWRGHLVRGRLACARQGQRGFDRFARCLMDLACVSKASL